MSKTVEIWTDAQRRAKKLVNLRDQLHALRSREAPLAMRAAIAREIEQLEKTQQEGRYGE